MTSPSNFGILRLALFGATLLSAAACLQAVGPGTVDGSVCSGTNCKADAGAALHDASVNLPDASTCTPLSKAADYPVKVMFLVENSGAMCVLDPPGAQASSAICDEVHVTNSTPGRVTALQGFITKNIARPNVSLALLRWDISVQFYPVITASGAAFVPVSDPSISSQIAALQNELGKASDLQGALGSAYAALESDILASPADLRTRTKYLVVLLSAGLPYPRCSANDNLTTWATAANPDGTWQDNPGTFCNSVCDPTSGAVCIDSFTPGGDRNQNSQLFGLVDKMIALKSTYGLGDLKVHTRLLFDQATATGLGTVGQDLLGYSVADAHTIGTWTMTQIARTHGAGTFADPGAPSTLAIDDLDTTALTTFCQ